MAQYMPKTLAKTLTYMIYHSPAEHGLFWDPGGTMPWKELYWALQEDPALRFVRESHLREIAYLGIEFPARLDGNVLRLDESHPAPYYPVVGEPPERLYYACTRKHYAFVLEHGLSSAGRPSFPLASEKDLALRIGKRRDPEPILIEVLAAEAALEGALFRKAGPELYLAEALETRFLLFPQLKAEQLERLTAKKKKEKEPKPAAPPTPGSYFLDPRFLQQHPESQKDAPGKGKKKGRGAEWKRDSRKERQKREI